MPDVNLVRTWKDDLPAKALHHHPNDPRGPPSDYEPANTHDQCYDYAERSGNPDNLPPCDTREDRSGSNIYLASKGMTKEESHSNAAYYCAGATLVGAAAVAFCLIKKRENKENETPFLACDDDYLIAKL